MGNMDIWDAVEKTDPDYTKDVTFGRKFTAIDAHYQIMMATKQFGPIGIGWGYETGEPIFQNQFVIVPVTLWHSDRGNTFGPIYGCCEMFGKRPDSDAPKKATTDGVTKALAQLGFNADVFLKKFDDNKYVEQLKAEKSANDPAQIAIREKGAAEYTADVVSRLQTADAIQAASILQIEQAKIARIKAGYPDMFARIETAAANAGAPMREAA